MITGFGRLGAPFAAQYFGVTPDIMTTAKGITNGAIPMGAVFASRAGPRRRDARARRRAIELFHGYTYSGHPVACAAGLATLDIYEREGLFDPRRGAGAGLGGGGPRACATAPHVIDIRNLGLMAGDRARAAPRRARRARLRGVGEGAARPGVLVRVTGDTIALSPPLIVSEDEIDRLFATLRSVLEGLD